MKSAFGLKIMTGLGWCLFVLVTSTRILTAQNTETPQPAADSTLAAIVIGVQPDQYKRTCFPVHSLLLDTNYRAYLEASTLR